MKNKSSLMLALRDTPFIKVLEFMIDKGIVFDYSMTEIANNCNVSRATVNKVIPRLLELGIIKNARLTQIILRLNKEISKEAMQKNKQSL